MRVHLVLALALGLGACGGSDESDDGNDGGGADAAGSGGGSGGGGDCAELCAQAHACCLAHQRANDPGGDPAVHAQGCNPTLGADAVTRDCGSSAAAKAAACQNYLDMFGPANPSVAECQ